MNILCKIFGHKIYGAPDHIMDKPCHRKSCDHVEPKIKCPRPLWPPMPKVKPLTNITDFEIARRLLNWLAKMTPKNRPLKMIKLTHNEQVELAKTTTFSLTQIRELFGRK